MSGTHAVPLTDPQVRVVNEVLSLVLNDPDWSEIFGQRDMATLGRAHAVVQEHLIAVDTSCKHCGARGHAAWE